MKPIIVLQSDFSLAWSAVASMKGVIKSVDRTLDIEDGTHEIEPYNIWLAAEELRTVESCFPKGTVFVSVVDPGVGTSRKASVALLKDGSYVVTPDNGTLSLVKETVGIHEIREIDVPRNRLTTHEKINVFEGRDVFAYVAARLASGCIAFSEVGELYSVDDVVECEELRAKPILKEGYAKGFVTYGLSHFGGIRLSITNVQFEEVCGFQLNDLIHTKITHEGKVLFEDDVKFVKSFGYVEKGEPLLYFGSQLYVSLDLNCANFMQTYDVHAGIAYEVEFTKG